MIELNVLECTQGSCVSTWDIRNTTTLCNTCENVSLKSLCKKKASVEMVVTDCDEVSYKVNVGHVLIGKLFTVFISNNSMKVLVKNWYKTFSFRISKYMECIQVDRWHFL